MVCEFREGEGLVAEGRAVSEHLVGVVAEFDIDVVMPRQPVQHFVEGRIAEHQPSVAPCAFILDAHLRAGQRTRPTVENHLLARLDAHRRAVGGDDVHTALFEHRAEVACRV